MTFHWSRKGRQRQNHRTGQEPRRSGFPLSDWFRRIEPVPVIAVALAGRRAQQGVPLRVFAPRWSVPGIILFVRCHDCLGRPFGCRLHSGRALPLRTFGGRAARFRIDRTSPTLRLQLALVLGRRSFGGMIGLSKGGPGSQQHRRTRNSCQSSHEGAP